MAKVLKIGITKNKGGHINEVNEVEVIHGSGIVNDRHFRQDNHIKSQITLIEVENINNYNEFTGSNIPAINFRRNIITENIKLNNLVGNEFYIGKIKVKAHDLCRPCKYLQEILKQKKLVEEFLHKGGLRCEILSSGKIFINDIIKK